MKASMPAPPPPTALLWRSLRIYQLFGANTDVGKTVFVTLLARAARKLGPDVGVAYLKPVSTGPASQADDRYDGTCPRGWASLETDGFLPGGGETRAALRPGRHMPDAVRVRPRGQPARRGAGLGPGESRPLCSPRAGGRVLTGGGRGREEAQAVPDNETLLDRCRAAAGECAARRGPGWLWVETAGGVLSPGPSGTPQAQLYAPLRLPAVLVGDARLGGISQTLAAWEALRLRGYQVEALLLFGGGGDDGNAAYLAGAMGGSGPAVMGVAAPPARDGHDPVGDAEAMAAYYARDDCARAADAALAHLDRRHEARVAELESLAARAQARLWYPFTQQGWLTAADITVIDSAHGDLLQTAARRGGDAGEDQPLLRASFDGSASWWTQGLGHGHPALTLAAASAAGRYGHVLLAGTAHAPAVAAAEALLDGVASPRLRRVFFSDNGSTGVEAAVKMGLRAARLRYGAGGPPLAVLGLRGGYHGDTLGAMACAAPGPFNRKVEWYDGVRGHWLAHAAVLCVDGVWTVSAAADADADLRACLGPDRRLPSLGHVFDLDARERRGEHRPYEAYVARALRHLRRRGRRLGALVLEPVVLGAGGMTLVDPLFQRALVNVVRRSPELVAPAGWSSPHSRDGLDWSGLPVIFDEVFTGLYRLGRFTSASFLGVQADISVHAKLLTGGLVPLCATLASEAVFDSFRGPDPSDALLHGHSYTAHPVGCQAAVAALRELRAMERRGAWDWAKMPARGWAEPSRVWSVWPASLVERLSRRRPRVKGVWALGSVLAVHLDAGPAAGYGSDAAAGLRDALARGRAPWSAHVRVLGNVLYVMASQTTAEASVGHLASLLDEALAS